MQANNPLPSQLTQKLISYNEESSMLFSKHLNEANGRVVDQVAPRKIKKFLTDTDSEMRRVRF